MAITSALLVPLHPFQPDDTLGFLMISATESPSDNKVRWVFGYSLPATVPDHPNYLREMYWTNLDSARILK